MERSVEQSFHNVFTFDLLLCSLLPPRSEGVHSEPDVYTRSQWTVAVRHDRVNEHTIHIHITQVNRVSIGRLRLDNYMAV